MGILFFLTKLGGDVLLQCFGRRTKLYCDQSDIIVIYNASYRNNTNVTFNLRHNNSLLLLGNEIRLEESTPKHTPSTHKVSGSNAGERGVPKTIIPQIHSYGDTETDDH